MKGEKCEELKMQNVTLLREIGELNAQSKEIEQYIDELKPKLKEESYKAKKVFLKHTALVFGNVAATVGNVVGSLVLTFKKIK